ncbi:MAG: FIST C-terminal domain-containing protein [Verrucomicrobia bacterium]|nr:FIST C-terminal domain-containing protein [Verrucomicrobiota bacterium]
MKPDEHLYAVSDHWDGPFEEVRFEAWAFQLRNRLKADKVDVGFVFSTPGYGGQFEEILEILQIHCQVPHLLGCTGFSLVSQGFEFEHGEGISVALYSLPGASLESFEIPSQDNNQDALGDPQSIALNLATESPNGFVIFADPYSLNAENMLAYFNRQYPGVPVLGGLACGTRERHQTTLFQNTRAIDSGAVGVAVSGDVMIESMISQGCQPVGDSYTITSSTNNVLEGIANRKAYDVLSDVFSDLPDALKLKSRGNLHVGFVIDEYQHEFERGDFLVRNLIGADPKLGVLLVGALPRVGQTLQFQMRDRHAAMDDLNTRLEAVRESFDDREVYGALLTTCTGRGKAFFKVPDFDASSIQESIGPLGMAGFFGNGEFGPVGGVNFVHGYTAALAVFVKKVLDS